MPGTLNQLELPRELGDGWDELVAAWKEDQNAARLWSKDASLWTGADEARWLDWLGIIERQLARPGSLTSLRQEAAAGDFDDILLLGMGGSSLCPETLAKCLGRQQGFPALHVLDSTDPAQVQALASRLDLTRTLFFVSSKSGTTLESDILRRYFYRRAGEELGRNSGDRFVAITDPGSMLEEIALRDRYRHVFYGLPQIGGRYSALSHFGMAPAAAMGIDPVDFLERAAAMAEACGPDHAAGENPGVDLGLCLGYLANRGRDKVTFAASPALSALGAWLEQLLAESTGKGGKAIIPVDIEELGSPEVYGADRVFVEISLGSDSPHAAQIAALEEADHPVLRIRAEDVRNLGQEFFRWEIATAAAGAVMGLNPFDQPDVEASKAVTRRLMAGYESSRELPRETPFFEADGVKLFAEPRYAVELARAAEAEESLEAYVRAHFGRAGEGDYAALLAWVEMNAANEEILQRIRLRVRDVTRTATCLGFGPRFLHSTGQAYKGGPNAAVVLQITCDDAADVNVPGKPYTFGLVKAAQARGDLEVLTARGRRALRVHLAELEPGLERLAVAIETALP